MNEKGPEERIQGQDQQKQQLTFQHIAYLNERKAEIKAAHNRYLEAHPEIKGILNDLLCAVLLKKPANVYSFVNDHFQLMRGSSIMDEGSYPPLVIAGPAGVGKTTLLGLLQEKYGDYFGFSVSHTTRGPRPGEQNGVHYNYVSRIDMQTQVDDGKFIEWAEVQGNLYGTSFESVEKLSRIGKICILDIDIQGVKKVKHSHLHTKLLFIAPPSLEVLEGRLCSRGVYSEDELQKRMASAEKEIQFGVEENQGKNFDAVVYNDKSPEECFAQQIEPIVLSWYPQLAGGGR